MNWVSKLVQSRKDFVPQPDSQTCQSACIAMITGGSVAAIRASLTACGTAGDPAVMGNYLKQRVKEYKFDDTASLLDARSAIDNGYQLIVHTWLSRSGHVIKLSGYELDPKTMSYRFIVDDPWSEFDGRSFSYPDPNKSGNNVRYSSYLMYAVGVAGQSFDDADRIYDRGELNSSMGNMWMHMIKV